MLETGIFIIGLMTFALIIQQKFKIPLPITLILSTLGLASFNIHPIDISAHSFDEMLLLLLPLLLMGDVLLLKTQDLKDNWLSVLSTAGIAVGLSISIGVLLQEVMLPGYAISMPAMVALMTMVVATDPVTVASIFGNAKLPHKLKFLAESESLFNDATAFAIFMVAISLMQTPMDTAGIIATFSIATLGALATGTAVGFIGMYALKISDDPTIETGILLLIAYSAFLISEHFHFAGIFAIVVSMVLAKALISSREDMVKATDNSLMEQRIEANQLPEQPSHWQQSLQHLRATKQNSSQILQFVLFAALVANIILFISIAELINVQMLSHYWKEIVSVFVVTTIIRMVTMAQFAWVSNRTSMQNVSTDWWMILTLAGVKGGLSILMVHMIPKTFEYKELFEAVVIGNIMLSIMIYAPLMMLIIKLRQHKFNEEDGHTTHD